MSLAEFDNPLQLHRVSDGKIISINAETTQHQQRPVCEKLHLLSRATYDEVALIKYPDIREMIKSTDIRIRAVNGDIRKLRANNCTFSFGRSISLTIVTIISVVEPKSYDKKAYPNI